MKRILHDLSVGFLCAVLAVLFAVVAANSFAPARDRSHVITVKDLLP